MPRAEVEEANRKLGAKKQPAEFEAHCEYLSAWEEDKWTVAQANVELDEKGRIVPDLSQRPPGRQLRAQAAG